ncbi:pseudouridine synthase [Multifurca ochricompacta]|uniref:Pseudouridine synthase n=1 Tax=Multifurca ochricompacta TaxID=376703 RepID=A0AAD4M491_9AGAM|nr:pseudouridine synthase [Multifurca ochricompacta]
MDHPVPQKQELVSHTTDPPDFESWTREELIARLKELSYSSTSHPSAPSQTSSASKTDLDPDQEPKSPSKSQKLKKSKSSKREFDFSAYPTRKIALKFSYAGAGFGGLAWQTGPTPLPTVEGVLFAALSKARLVDPDGGLEGCGWERCGRTDRGVSGAGQVVSLYVRSSNRPSSTPLPSSTTETSPGASGDVNPAMTTNTEGSDLPPLDALSQATVNSNVAPASTSASIPTKSDPEGTKDLRYLHTLNAILPPSIRVYAWAPVAPTFSARFSCRTRHYKYFFSARNLDVDGMRAGAARLVGEHDFRNLCKLDPAKQLTSFRRRIVRADISPLVNRGGNGNGNGDGSKGMHVLDLIGSAFLYNQVRHIMAVLLLIGARLESPSVISALLNADPDESDGGRVPVVPEGETPPPRVTCKPEYQMADALPLVLWDCEYAPEDAGWRTDDTGSDGGSVGLHSQLVGLAERAQVEATLAEHFLAAASEFHAPAPPGRYVRLLERKRLESVEVVNARWRSRRGLNLSMGPGRSIT